MKSRTPRVRLAQVAKAARVSMSTASLVLNGRGDHFNPQTQKAARVGVKVLEDGRKVRVFKSNREMVDV